MSTYRVKRINATKLSIHLPIHLFSIYKSFVRHNESFESRIESIKYKACLPITGAIQGTSRERLYWELGLESLSSRCWFRKLTFFIKNDTSISH